MLQLLDGALKNSMDVPDRTITINEQQRQSLKDPEDVIRPRQVREARGVGTFGAGVKLEPKYLKQCSSCKRLVKTRARNESRILRVLLVSVPTCNRSLINHNRRV